MEWWRDVGVERMEMGGKRDDMSGQGRIASRVEKEKKSKERKEKERETKATQ